MGDLDGTVGTLDPNIETAGIRADTINDVTSSVSFGSARAPSDGPHLVLITITVEATGGNAGSIQFQIDGTVRVEAGVDTASGALTGNPDVIQTESTTFLVPKGSSYTVVNNLDPAGTNSIDRANEIPL